MAIPTGAGTEVLKRVSLKGLTTSFQAILAGADADHIYTILSVIFSENAGDAEKVDMQVDISAAGSNQITLLDRVDLAARDTYVFNEKLVMTGTDQLEVKAQTAASIDVYVSYIDQHF